VICDPSGPMKNGSIVWGLSDKAYPPLLF
jgi:hypothetical protein